jgi:hypothetical protein
MGIVPSQQSRCDIGRLGVHRAAMAWVW